MKFSFYKNGIFLLILFICTTACDPLKKVQPSTGSTQQQGEELDEIEGKRVYNQETGKYEVVTDVTGEMETINWEEESNATPPISSEATDSGIVVNNPNDATNNTDNTDSVLDENTDFLPSYNMVLALPFMTHQNYTNDDAVNPKSIPALNFYEGAKMAFDVLSNEGVNLEVNVLDTKAGEDDTRNLTSLSTLQEAHLIIGTFRNSTAKIMAEYAQARQIPFVSPYYPHNALVENNPYFIQLNPSVFAHTDAAIQFLKSKYQDDQIVLVGRKTRRDQGMLNLYQKAHYKYSGTTDVSPLKQIIIEDNTSSLEDTSLKEHFVKDRPTIFLIASSQESFAYAILRKIDIEKKNFDEENEDIALEDDPVIVFGQPKWKDFTKISYDSYEKLNLHITSESFVNPNNPSIKAFRQNFYNRYGTLPTEEAIKGYDTVLFFGRQLKNKGTGFLNTLDQERDNGLLTQFTIDRIVTQQREVSDDNLSIFDQHENSNIHVLEFRGFQFLEVQR